MDPNQSSTSSKECDRCQENIQKRCQVEEENKNLKEGLRKLTKWVEKQGEWLEKQTKSSENIRKN